MDLILCHTTADFDAVGAAVGLSRLKIGSKIVLTGGAHPTVRDFLALYRDEFPLLERRSVREQEISSLIIPDSQQGDRFGKAAEWFTLPHLKAIEIYDHHVHVNCDIPATYRQIEPVGATTTIIVELLQGNNIVLTNFEATIMALGIHVDTGSLTYDQTTPRDAQALAWLMCQGANVKIIAEYVEPSLSTELQKLLTIALEQLNKTTIRGYTIASVLLKTENFVPGLSNVVSRLVDLTETDALLLGHCYIRKKSEQSNTPETRLTIIGRTRIPETNLQKIFSKYGGGGHSQAASLNLARVDPDSTLHRLFAELQAQIPHPPTARDLMSSPVRTILPQTTIKQAQRILFRYGHSGLSVVSETGELLGIISRRDLDLALHHGFSHAPVKGYMTGNVKTITPETTLPEIESLMVTYDVGRLPVLSGHKLIGIVTRTDVLRQLHQERDEQQNLHSENPRTVCLLPRIVNRLFPPIWQLLNQIAQEAEKRGWHLYIVGGAVRDLLLSETEAESLLLQDIDLVVDGFHNATDDYAGVELAKFLQTIYPDTRLSIHGDFQTAALFWHKDRDLGSLWLDIATARTEFYPYPAANPEVEASSIRQDLYRRDFTINSLALRLTSPRQGELLDFFGGLIDLRNREIRVLHSNSFIEDPTRIYRAVRFAVRLGFEIESQTRIYINYAIESGIYQRLRLQKHPAPALTTRLRTELKYILEASYWKRALKLLNSLNALHCLDTNLTLTSQLWWQIRCLSRWLKFIDPENKLSHWLLRLEILIASLNHDARCHLAHNLQLPKNSYKRLQTLEEVENQVQKFLFTSHTLSELVMFLRQYNSVTLLLIAVRNNISIRCSLWYYFTKWLHIQAPLNGTDLKRLGYPPGPNYQVILNHLLKATLDGEINNYLDAENFVQKNYPLES
jgi:tRNA nucleotidyltransferase (CCA-adding enzyme)